MKTICTKCGKEIRDDASFCKTCGSPAQGGDRLLDQKRSRVLARERTWLKPAVVAAGVALIALAGWMVSSASHAPRAGGMMATAKGGPRPLASPVTPEQGTITIPVNVLDDTAPRYFVHSAGGKDIRFFLLRAPDGSIRAALDACTACYRAKLGYSPAGDKVVCNNCGMTFRSTDVGVVSGGCSPIPVNRTVDGQNVTIQAKEIEAGAKYF